MKNYVTPLLIKISEVTDDLNNFTFFTKHVIIDLRFVNQCIRRSMMKSKLQFFIFGSIIYISTSFILYQKGFLNGYKIGYKNALEVHSKKSEQSRTE